MHVHASLWREGVIALSAHRGATFHAFSGASSRAFYELAIACVVLFVCRALVSFFCLR